MPDDLKVGDVVQLKSGGPKMTVAQLVEAQAVCRWFPDDDCCACTETFPCACLIRIESGAA